MKPTHTIDYSNMQTHLINKAPRNDIFGSKRMLDKSGTNFNSGLGTDF